MPSSSDVVDEYLAGRFAVGLEQVLLDATRGSLTSVLTGCASVEAGRTRRWPYADGGASERYDGALTLDGVRYQFAVEIFVDEDGARYVTDVPLFDPVSWTTSLRLVAGGEGAS
jgi:hypothetical protein